MDMDMEHGHGHGTWTWDMDMDMEHTWNMDMDMHGGVHLSCTDRAHHGMRLCEYIPRPVHVLLEANRRGLPPGRRSPE
jgi:hypothetical protein